MWWSLGIGAAGNIAMTLILRTLGPNMMPTSWLGFALIPLRTISVPALSLGYICIVIRLCHDPTWRARLARFGAVGRTALTNYLMHPSPIAADHVLAAQRLPRPAASHKKDEDDEFSDRYPRCSGRHKNDRATTSR